jgi:succinyl-diaminopimelate desuccinylase
MDIDIKNVTSINGGLVANSVIDEVHCLMKHDANLGSAAATFFKLSQATYQIIPHGDEDELIIYGKSAHGSTPQFGVNAGLHLLKFLGWYQNNEHLSDLADSYLETTGKKLNSYYESENLHNSTYNVGLISYANHHLKLVVNFRYPENCDPHQVEEKLNLLGKGKITFLEYGEPLYMNPNSKMIQTLLHVYQDETKDYSTPMMTIGGGTYAKESKNTIAFGSAFPSRNDKIHSPNEEIHLVDFLSSQSIYARAINELGKLK